MNDTAPASAAARHDKNTTGLVIGISAALVACMVAVLMSEWHSDPQKRRAADIERAYAAAQEALQDGYLKAPSTAMFQPVRSIEVITRSRHTYELGFWVDAQNSFGAMLRGNYRAVVVEGAEGWSVVRVIAPTQYADALP